METINKVIGPLLFIASLYLLPHGVFDTFQSRAAIGTVLWMAYWWITEALDYAVTAFLPIIVNALFNLVDMKDVIANYASETILLLLGASILTVSWEIVGLDKRVACAFLSIVGTSLTTQILFWFLLSTALSTILPNAVVTATITPIAVSMLRYLGIEKVSESEPASIILMSIAWGAGIGGLASPLGHESGCGKLYPGADRTGIYVHGLGHQVCTDHACADHIQLSVSDLDQAKA